MAIGVSCSHKNPLLQEWNTPYGIPPFEEIKTADYMPAIKEGIRQQNAEIWAIVNNSEPADFENTVAAYELSGDILAKVTGILYNISESDGTKEILKLMEEVTPLLTEHEDNILMNKDFFKRVKAVYDADQSKLTREQQMVLKKLYLSFTRNGIDLEDADRERLKEINKSLAAMQQKFGNNLLAENNAFKAEFGIPISSYSQEMTTCEDRGLREKMFKAYSSRGNNGNEYDNKELCLSILKLRAEKAKLMGFRNFAEYQLDNKMAKTPEIVDAFLGKIMAAASAKSKKEVADMQAAMNKDIVAGLLPLGTRIKPWDWFYYAEKVRKAKYNLDEELTRPYFQCDSVRKGVFEVANRLYGVNFEKLEDIPTYNSSAVKYKLTDSDGKLIGIFYGDYYPRDTKRGGAWMNNFREQYRNAAGEDVRPIIVNICNFTPPTDSLPSLLTVDEVETMFHEFGHALHGFLSKCNYRSVSGTNVARDFVETFSQFNENWAFLPEILATYAKHYETKEIIPDSLVNKINNAKKFNQGFMTAELCAASILDMKWHELSLESLENIDIASFENEVCKNIGLIEEIIPRYKTTYFNHIFNSGYSAGYYGYLWSEVLDKDAFEYFESKGVFNPEVAEAFKKIFLERGGSEEPMVLYEMFRGAKPDPLALVRARGLN